MIRAMLLLGWATAAVAAPDSELYRKFEYLAPGPKLDEPLSALHEMHEPGVELRFLLQFRYGLYAITPTGEIRPATAGVRVEYNRADEPTGKDNPFVPAALQPELNEEWTGDNASPGFWFTEAATSDPIERVGVLRFPERGRYRVRITGLYNESASARRVPVLTAVLELRELDEPEPLPEPQLQPDPEPQLEPLPEPGPETEPEVIYVPTPVIVTVTPTCPFCYRRLHSSIHDRLGRHFYCSFCSGIVHHYADGRRRGSILEGGHRRDYDLVHGRALGFRHRVGQHSLNVHTPTHTVTRRPRVLHPNRPLTRTPTVRNPHRPLIRMPTVRKSGSREPRAQQPNRPGVRQPSMRRRRAGIRVRRGASPSPTRRTDRRRQNPGRVTPPASRQPAVKPVRRAAPRPAGRSGRSRARRTNARPLRFRKPATRRPVMRRPIARKPVMRKPITRRPVMRRPVVRKPAPRSPRVRTRSRPARRSFRRPMRLPPFNRPK